VASARPLPYAQNVPTASGGWRLSVEGSVDRGAPLCAVSYAPAAATGADHG
jgi:hypothetical protein